MSDVSGIPYMGPMGVGNLYAPLFPASGMSTPSAAQISYNWAPEGNYSQNVINNLYSSGGGFGRQTDYYSGLGASYSAAGMSPYGIFSEGGGGGGSSPFSYGGYGTGGGGGGYTAPSVNDPSINWGQLFGGGGGGSLFTPQSNNYDTFQSGWGNVSNTMPQGGMYQGMAQAIDWGNLFGGGGGGGGSSFAPPASSYDTFQGGWGNVSDRMPQGGAYQGMAKPIDWSNWLGGGETPQPQQQPTNFGSLFGQGVGGSATEPYPAENTVADPNRVTYGGYGQGGATSALPGYMADNQLPSSLRPSAAPEQGSRTYDFAPMFEGGGGGGGFGAGGGDTAGTEAATSGSLGGNAFTYNPYATGAGGGFEQSPGSKAEQGRASLASLIGGPSVEQQTAEYRKAQAEAEKAAEAPVVAGDEAVPLPRERPVGADAQPAVTPGATTPATDLYPGANPPRPPANIPFTVQPGREASIRGVQPRLSAAVQGGATFLPPGYTVEAYSGERSGKEQAYHRGGRAMDVRIIGPDGPIPSEGADSTGMYTLLARGVKTWVTQNDPQLAGQMGYGGAFGTKRGSSGGANDVPDLMHYDLGGSRGSLRPDVQFGRLQPLTAEERNAMPANIPLLGDNQVALDPRGAGPIGAQVAAPPLETRPGVNQGQDITPPPASIPDPRVSSGGFNALDAAANVPKGPTGVEKAQTFLNRPVESILQQYSPQSLTAAGFAMDVKQPLREALKGPFGSQILEGLQTRANELGLTKSDFNRAIADPKARSDLGPEIPSGMMSSNSLFGGAGNDELLGGVEGDSFAARFAGEFNPSTFQSPSNDYDVFQAIERYPYDEYSDVMPPNPTPADKASVRFNNPGAMAPGGEESKAYGATAAVTGQIDPGTGKPYPIASFDDPIAGMAANFALMDRVYADKMVKALTEKWSNNLRSTTPPYPGDLFVTHDMARDPDWAIPFMKAHIKGEAPGNYPMSERDWRKAHDMFTGKYPGD